MGNRYDAVVVGAGPNGLTAGICLAEAGLSVLLIEANETVGGAARTCSLIDSDVIHDMGSAVHPMGVASPIFRALELGENVNWLHPEVPLAHPLEGGEVAVQHRSLDQTADGLLDDARRYRALFAPLTARWENLIHEVLQPPFHLPTHPILLARFGLYAMLPASYLASAFFQSDKARALFTGVAAHANYSLKVPLTSAIGIVLGTLSHAVGWPVPQGGAQSISDALASRFEALGGRIETNWRVKSLQEVPSADITLLNLTPRQILSVAGPDLPKSYEKRLSSFRYGPAAFKLDYVLKEPIPWQNELCRKAGTVHLGGSSAEIIAAEEAVHRGTVADKPYVLLSQPSVVDDSRAPDGVHVAWMYAHVPAGYDGDYADVIEKQVERFAPGFRDCVEERFVSTPAILQEQNPNLVEGDFTGGSMSPRQIVARPTLSLSPYRTPMAGLYICSSSTPPGGSVHGMCGYNAAKCALADLGLPNPFRTANTM